MKRYWLVLAAALMLGGISAGLAQTESDSSRAPVSDQDVDRQRPAAEADRELRDAPAGGVSPTQQRDLRRPPAGGTDMAPGTEARPGGAPGEETAADARVGDQGGNAGLVIGGLFLALIVFILYRRSRRVDTTPYNRP